MVAHCAANCDRGPSNLLRDFWISFTQTAQGIRNEGTGNLREKVCRSGTERSLDT
jgi:hypothetical protein